MKRILLSPTTDKVSLSMIPSSDSLNLFNGTLALKPRYYVLRKEYLQDLCDKDKAAY